jgi:hypothetical protein
MRQWAMPTAVGVLGSMSLVVVGLGVAVAAGASGAIHGCVAKSDGTLRIVHSAKSCGAHEKPLSFDSRGPRGLQGPAGPAGSTGPAGPPGPAGGSASSTTVTLYANVDAEGDLGSNSGATGASRIAAGNYAVAFDRPIGSCAAVAQAGQAGGTDPILPIPSAVSFDPSNPKQWDLQFVDGPTRTALNTAFMLIVVCPS